MEICIKDSAKSETVLFIILQQVKWRLVYRQWEGTNIILVHRMEICLFPAGITENIMVLTGCVMVLLQER